MHELPVIEKILDVVLRHAARNRVGRVAAIHVEVGVLSDLEEGWMQRYFDRVARGTLAEGAKLKVERVSPRGRCNGCSESFPVGADPGGGHACPACGSRSWELVAGKGYFIRSMEAV